MLNKFIIVIYYGDLMLNKFIIVIDMVIWC